MIEKALVFSENEFGKVDGKVANGLIRYSERYKIVGIIDSTKAGLDAGECLDGIKKGIPIFSSIDDALEKLNYIPKYFIYGIAPLSPFLDKEQRQIIITAMEKGMDIVNPLPEFFADDKEFMQKASECNVKIFDFRKPPKRKGLHLFTGKIFENKTPVIVVTGTDCAVGKMTTARIIVEALKKENINAVFIATGQTGLLQGAKYGMALDVLTSGFTTGEVEKAIIDAVNTEHPDIIIVEGQGGLSHPAFNSSSAIIKGSNADAIIIQHPPKRKSRCDFPTIPMPTLESEIKLNEMFSKSKVIAITLNDEDMTDTELINTIAEYEDRYQLPTTNVLKYGCDNIIKKIFEVFPEILK
ncbi:DUF1611 domain-containing protein [Lutibacter sp.]|uniref:DUF1611 domain-containing protein n=1 Tax=Lutibacter sp. TaxID=1925666 RepID=UPI0025BBC7EB|nr:DUF1611 domain-containing protein [Lutibacter sp.]MCF6181444.1 DUF1611 domain-containing protein [Lutibacter sp.]